MIKNKKFDVIILITACITFYFALKGVFKSSMNYDSDFIHPLCYFTIQSNIIIAAWFTSIGISGLLGKQDKCFLVKLPYAALFTTYILITGIIYWSVLYPIMGRGDGMNFFSFSNVWLHTVTPIFSLYLLFDIRKDKKMHKAKSFKLVYFYIYPVFYLTLALALAIDGRYVYPFFNPNSMGGWLFVILTLLGIVMVFTGVYLILKKEPKQKS